MNSISELKQTYSYDDVTLIPSYSELTSRSQTDCSIDGYKLPIIMSPMDTVTTPQMIKLFVDNKIPATVHRAFNNVHDQLNYVFKDFTEPNDLDQILKYTWFSVGSVFKYKDWIDHLCAMGIKNVLIDMAHGDSKTCVDTIRYIKQNYPTVHIIAGNVATESGFLRLKQAGADGVRVGIASGQICSTALETGFGVPILTNIIDCAKVKGDTWLIADGGCKSTGDIAKAVYFGADFVMIGKMLASTDLACGDCYNKDKQKLMPYNTKTKKERFNCIYPHQFEDSYKLAEELDFRNQDFDDNKFKNLCKQNLVAYKEYHGMASRAARSGVLTYNSVEGVEGLTKYSGTTEQFINDTKLRLQASLSYGGSRNWEEFREKVQACLRSNAGILAAQTHLDVTFK